MKHKQNLPRILLITPRNHEFMAFSCPHFLAPILRSKFEKNNMDVTLCHDDKFTEAIALLSGQKFDVIFYCCPEVWQEGRGGTIQERAWSILEARLKTLNATTPIIAFTTSPASADMNRMPTLGVSRIFDIHSDLSARQIVQAVEEKFAPTTNLVPH